MKMATLEELRIQKWAEHGLSLCSTGAWCKAGQGRLGANDRDLGVGLMLVRYHQLFKVGGIYCDFLIYIPSFLSGGPPI